MEGTRTFSDVFEETCDKASARKCVIYFQDETLKTITYSEMFDCFRRIYDMLQKENGRRRIVGLCMKHNPLIPAFVAAIHKSESSFMFLDATINHNDKSLTDLNISHIVTIKEQKCADLFGFREESDLTFSMLDFTIQLYKIKVENEFSNGGEIAYYIRTTGTTGVPKTIAVPHRCIDPNIEDFKLLCPLSEDDVIYFSTPLTFDPSMIELYLAVYAGCPLFIGPSNLNILFPLVTFWQTTPSKFNLWPDRGIASVILSENSSLKYLLLGGECCQSVVRRIRGLRNASNHTKMFNVYGITEMSCWATVSEIRNDSNERIPIGECLSETDIKIVDKNGGKIEIGTGEIYIGSCVRKCIINGANLKTEEDSLSWIATGDIGEIQQGLIYFEKRCDAVVKRFGHKVDLNRIETAALSLRYIKQCCCIWIPERNTLKLFYESIKVEKELMQHLKKQLPVTHYPDEFYNVEKMPLNAHGKICKNSLARICDRNVDTSNIQESFVFEMKDILGCENDFRKSFIASGGNSFKAVALVNKLEERTCRQFPKLLLLLLDPSIPIERCVNMLPQQNENGKRMIPFDLTNNSKIARANNSRKLTLSINWMYNLGKCVDAKPTVFKRKDGITITTIGSHSGKVAILNVESGEELGFIDVQARVEAPVFCFRNTVFNRDCGVVGTYDSSLWCFDLETCKVYWKTMILPSMIKSKVCSLDSILYVASYDSCIRALFIGDGSIMLTREIGRCGITADLVLSERLNALFVATLDGYLVAYTLEPNEPIMETKWKQIFKSPIFSTPTLLPNDKGIVISEVIGEIHCLSTSSGDKMWSFAPDNGQIFSSILLHHNLIYFGSQYGDITCMERFNDRLSFEWSVKIQGKIYASPILYKDNVVIVSHLGTVYVVNTKSREMSSIALPGEIFSTPELFKNSIVIGCRDDNVYSIKVEEDDVVCVSEVRTALVPS